MKINKVLVKYGTNLLKVYNQDQKVIDDYEDYMTGEISDEYYLSYIVPQARVHYSNSLESLIDFSIKSDNCEIILIKIMKIMNAILKENSEEIFIEKLIDMKSDELVNLINMGEISLNRTIKYLTKSIDITQMFHHRVKSESIFLNFINKNKDKLNRDALSNIFDEKISSLNKRKTKNVETFFMIIEGIYTLAKYLIGFEKKEKVFDILLEVFKEESTSSTDFTVEKITSKSKGAFTNSMKFMIEVLKIIELKDNEYTLVHKLISNNAILKIDRYLFNVPDYYKREGIDILRKYKIPEYIILCGVINGENPLLINPFCYYQNSWCKDDIEKSIEVFKFIKDYNSEYVLHGLLNSNESILEELSIKMVVAEFENRLNYKNSSVEFKRLLDNQDFSSDFIYLFDRNENIISVFRSIGAMTLVNYKPKIFTKYLAFIYRRSYSVCCSHIIKALRFKDNGLCDFSTLINYITSLGIDDKQVLNMHIIKLREGYYQKLTQIVKEKFKPLLEVLRENTIYNWQHWLEEMYDVIGDDLLEYSTFIINSGNVDAIRYIVDKIKGNKKFYNDITNNCNLCDLEIRKGVILYVLSIENTHKDEFLDCILKNETSKVIKDNINRYFQHVKLKELSKDGGRDYILSIIRSDKRGNKGFTKFDFLVAPRIRWKNENEEASIDVIKYILKTYVSNSYVVKNNEIKFILNELDKEDLKKFAFYALNTWLSNGAEAKEKWVLAFVGENGGRECLGILYNKIKEFSDNSRHAMALESLNALALSSDDMAINYINSIAIKFKYKKVKTAANECLQLAADNRGITRDELEDIIIPTLGFDKYGEREFNYGDRTFTVRLLVNNTLEVFDSNGKKYKNLPKGNKSDDDEKVKECEKEFKQLKKDLKSTVGIQCGRLENVLSTKRLWTFKDYKKVFIDNPIMNKFALGLIWGVYENGMLIKSFRYLEDGSFTTYDEDDFDINENMLLSLVHPLELSKEVKDGWIEQLEDYEITQPFLQINREYYTVNYELKDKDFYDEFNGREVNGFSLYNKLSKFGWERDVVEDAGFYYGLVKKISNGITVIFQNDGINVGYDYIGESTLGKLKFIKDSKSIKLKNINDRILSEVLYEINKSL